MRKLYKIAYQLLTNNCRLNSWLIKFGKHVFNEHSILVNIFQYQIVDGYFPVVLGSCFFNAYLLKAAGVRKEII